MTAPITVHVLPSLVNPAELAGCAAVIIDLLRASTTMTRALESGATAVVPCATTDDARRKRGGHGPGACLLGGERLGVRIDGFDLGNSPSEYTPDVVRGRTIYFTTTNGTRAVARALESAPPPQILIGCLANRSALAATLARAPRPVHLICAGTDGQVAAEDVICAGAIARVLIREHPTRFHPSGDGAQLALCAYASLPDHGALLAALREARGGRNLRALGLDADIVEAARIDASGTVPEFDLAAGAFVDPGRMAAPL